MFFIFFCQDVVPSAKLSMHQDVLICILPYLETIFIHILFLHSSSRAQKHSQDRRTLPSFLIGTICKTRTFYAHKIYLLLLVGIFISQSIFYAPNSFIWCIKLSFVQFLFCILSMETWNFLLLLFFCHYKKSLSFTFTFKPFLS